MHQFTCWLAACLLVPLISSAGLITDAASIPTSAAPLILSSSSELRIFSSRVQVAPGVSLSSTNPNGAYLGPGPYDFADNGVWFQDGVLAGVDVDLAGFDRYALTFHFASPVQAVGGFINYSKFIDSGFGDATISALDAFGMVLESYNLSREAPISSPGAFRGIVRTNSDIFHFSLENSAIAIRDVVVVSAIPEPGGRLTILSVLFALYLAARWRRL